MCHKIYGTFRPNFVQGCIETYLSAPNPPNVMLSARAVVHLIPAVQLHLSRLENTLRPRHSVSPSFIVQLAV